MLHVMLKVSSKTGQFDAPHPMFTGLDHYLNQIDKISIVVSQNH